MRKWIVCTTMLGLFSSHWMIDAGSVHLLYFYAFLLFNLIALGIAGWLWLPKGLWIFLAYLLCSGAFGILRGTDTLVGFLKSYAGVVPTVIYFLGFVRFMKFDTNRLFVWYASLSFYAAAFGLVYFRFQIMAPGRLLSVFQEPGGFALVCTPAVFYYADEWLDSRRHGFRFIVLLAAVVLTGSSSGFLGLLLGVYFCGTRFRYGKIVAPALALLVAVGIYNSSDLFRVRLNDTTQSIDEKDLTGSNQSTFGLVSNAFITEQVFRIHPLVGGGFGSHEVAYDRYIGQVEGAELFEATGLAGLGRWDASSLFLRIISELGLIGIAGSIGFLWYFWPREATVIERRIALTVICYVFIKFVRFGSYFDPEVFFFFCGYAVNGLRARVRMKRALSIESEPAPTSAALPSFEARA